jgi:hypothetical protein
MVEVEDMLKISLSLKQPLCMEICGPACEPCGRAAVLNSHITDALEFDFTLLPST